MARGARAQQQPQQPQERRAAKVGSKSGQQKRAAEAGSTCARWDQAGLGGAVTGWCLGCGLRAFISAGTAATIGEPPAEKRRPI
jgi:hypothetical protein